MNQLSPADSAVCTVVFKSQHHRWYTATHSHIQKVVDKLTTVLEDTSPVIQLAKG